MHPGSASIKTPRTRPDRQARPARSQNWRIHQDFGDPLPTGDRMNACSSRSIPALSIRYGQSAVRETEVIDNLSIVITTARIDTYLRGEQNRPKSPVSVGETRADRGLQISLERMLITRPRMAVTYRNEMTAWKRVVRRIDRLLTVTSEV